MGGEYTVERVINIKNCPLCHRPRLNSRAEMDIVTHLAVCASQDWARVDRMIVGNFVTASQAQRKWYTKVITKLSAGNYRIGAVCDYFVFFESKEKLIDLSLGFILDRILPTLLCKTA